MLKDPVIGKVIREIVPSDKMICLDDTFNYMPDLSKMSDGSIGGSASGSHAEGWRYTFLRVSPDGEVDILHACEDITHNKTTNTTNPLTYILHTNRDLNSAPPVTLKEWLDSVTGTVVKEIDNLIVTDGKKNLKISPEELAARSVAGSTSLDKQTTVINKLSDLSCDFKKSIKYGVYDNAIPESVTNLIQNEICVAIEDTYKKMVTSGDKATENLCKVADDMALDKGGYDEAVNWINRVTEQGDPLRNLVNNCAPNRRDDYNKRTVSDMNFNIYSAGTIKHWFRECPAVLIEIALSSGRSRGYYLHGLGSCDSVSTFKSFYKPNHGNELIKDYEYDGALPANFVKGGKEQPFYSEHVADTKPPPDPESRSQQQSVAPQQSTSSNSNVPSGSFGKRYADSAANLFEKSGNPACQTLAYTIRSLGSSGNPDYIIQKQVDSIIDHAPDACAY